MFKNIFFTVCATLALIGLLGGIKFVQISDLISAASTMTPPAPVVSSFTVEQQTWERTLKSVGTLEAVQGVVVSADLPGRVTEIFFNGGTDVTAGEPLLQQDISSELAQLRAAEANVELGQASLARVKELRAKGVNAQSDLDVAQAQYKEAVARADNIKTAIAKKTITAPFSGKLGIRLVNLGQDLPSGAPVVRLQAIDPMFVNFSLPQQHIEHVRLGLKVRILAEDKSVDPIVGEITAIDPEVDASTRNIRLQATIENGRQNLLPGMFVNVEVVLPEKEQVVAVPATAIMYATYGDSVYVLEEKKNEQGETQLVSQQHFVQLGRTMGDFIAIEKGVQVGQRVASAGLFKLANGAPVAVNNEVKPDFKLNPKPADQ